jgi:putative ABC transport system ATP-binding protein
MQSNGAGSILEKYNTEGSDIMDRKPEIVVMESVTKDYPMGEVTVHALRGMELSATAGEFLVLLGPSGCGKTTTLNLIGGLDQPTGGKITVQEEDITRYSENRLSDYRRRKVGFVFQFYNLIPTLTASENVEFALALTKRDGHRAALARELLDTVGLAERADHFPSQLSGGEQQRVAIARALANHPPLLLCDEPTGNLDAETGRQVLRAIRQLNRQEGTTVILVTHNTAIAPMAGRVVHLHNGAVERIETNSQPLDVAELAW